ncbi:rCG46775, isoform CRA_a [Rattus norvegicus]|uniref:RCG46775, isoform CRA_a n=2 Tax=Rattus norvegicus TaxID=10116 RepID=A6IX83_RAT|nr:rCG46775, isoform CRA_a [Rattus norvegicus]
MDRGSQWACLEMGGCHSKKVVIPDIENPARCRSVLGSYQSDTQPQNRPSGNSPDSGQTILTLEQLEHLEICLKEAEEKAKALLEQTSFFL